jgi:adenylate cyclase
VDIHGELIESIVTSNYLVRSPLADGAEVLLAILVGSLMIALVPLVGALPTLALGSIIAFFVLGGSWYLFNFERLLVDPVYPLMSSLAVFGVLVFSNYLSEERRRTEIRNAFSQYLSPALVAQLVRDPGRLKLGGETREITILFSDVRGFTRVAETFKEDPEGLTSLMNRLLTPLSNAVTSREGTIDKYMGDAIMAFWNAPLEDRKHTMNACQSALAMMDEMKRLNAERAERGADRVVDTLDVGIGISTGRVIVGNMGSDLRFDYTVMGDAVNLASRLEGLTRLYDCDVLIAQSTAATILDDFALIELDRVRVKGKAEAETIYALVGGETLKQDPLFARFEDDFQGMRRHYAAGQWEEAMRELASLNDSASAYRLAGTIRLYRERIKAFLLSGPPLDWDGVYNWSEK